MSKVKLFILFCIATLQVPHAYSQSELALLDPFLTQIINNDLNSGKKYCLSIDSVEPTLDTKWTNNDPIALWMSIKPSHKIITLFYLQNQISQLLIENIKDTIGLESLCAKFKISNCMLFKGYGDWQKAGRKTNWIILFKLKDAKNKANNVSKIEILDSAAYYQNVLKNPIFKYEYGFGCYESGEPPLGRLAINYLLKRNKLTVLQDINECDNNEGLMYIIEYYVRQKLTLPKNLEKALQRKISYCDGCTDSGAMTIAKMIKELNNDSTSFGSYLKYGYW